MEEQNYLGIYLGKSTATVVCLGLHGRQPDLRACFSVSTDDKEQANPQVVTNLIAQGCAQRAVEFSEAAVALDCAMFMQHNVHSEFTDQKQITATVKFDTEEALATDISEVAVAFKIISSGQDGSKLSVFTTQRKILSDILLCLQSSHIDPVTVEPDVNCLSRFIYRNLPLAEGLNTLFGLFSRQRGYLLGPVGAGARQEAQIMRTFLVGPTQDRSELLCRETLVTTALMESSEPVNYLKVFDSAHSVSTECLSQKLGIQTVDIDLVSLGGVDPQDLAECADPVEFAIAYGAALAILDKNRTINFRHDFMPYQGKKLRLQKALRVASVSVTVLLIAVGLFFQSQLFKLNNARNKLYKKFAKDYSAVMLGKKPPVKTSPVEKLRSELRRIRAVKSGLFMPGEESISSKLTLVLEAFNQCAPQTNLSIDSLSITSKAISIAGNTKANQNRNTLKFFEAIRNSGLEISTQNLYSKANRDHFNVTVVPKK